MKNIQLYPLPRVGIMLVLGIMLGDYISLDVPLWIWLVLASACVIVAIWMERYRCSFLILCATFFLGVWLIGNKESCMKKEELAYSSNDSSFSYQGIIASKPIVKGKVTQFDLLVVGKGKAIKLRTSVLRDTLSHKDEALTIGNDISITSSVKPFRNQNRSSNFDYARWANVHGYVGQTFIPIDGWKPCTVSLAPLSWLQRTRLATMQWREHIIQAMPHSDEHSPTHSIIAAMALGDKDMLDKDTKELYSVTGTSHILALSGLHLSILFSILLFIFPRRRMRMVSQIWLILTVWLYVLLTGMSPSIVRSATMLSLYGLLALSNRHALSLNTLSFAAIVMLIANPLTLWDVGFQMSFLSVAFIVLTWQWMSHYRVKNVITILVIIPIVAQLATFPLVMYYFGRFSCLFLLSNLVVIPMAYIVLYGMVAWVVLLPFPAISTVIFHFIEQVVEWGNKALSAIAALPHASISDIHISPLQVCFIYILIVCMLGMIHRLAKGHRQAKYLHLSDNI